MRHRFEDSCNKNMLNWKFYWKANSIRTWSLWKVQFLSEITSFLPLKFKHSNYFLVKDFYVPFMTLQSIGLNFLLKEWHSFAQLLSWRSLLWLSMTWQQSYLAQNNFLNITSLTWTLALHLLLCSFRRSIYSERKQTHTNTPSYSFV